MQNFHFKTPIRWMDMDAYGHVNNGRYCDYMVETRFEWFEKNISLRDWIQEEKIQFVMIKQVIEYVKPFTYPGEIEIIQSLKTIGRTSITLDYCMYLIPDLSDCYARAYAKLVAFSDKQKTSMVIPESLRQSLFVENS